MSIRSFLYCLIICLLFCCKKSKSPETPPASFNFNTATVNEVSSGLSYTNLNLTPIIKISFSAPLKTSSVSSSVSFTSNSGTTVAFTSTLENSNSTLIIKPAAPLQAFGKYLLEISIGLFSENGGSLERPVSLSLSTGMDSTDKFPLISDDALLTLIQQQTFKYFWDFGHPISGLARERNTSGDVVTSGGSGFGIMAIVIAVNRQFITRVEGLARMQKIVEFLKTKADKFHGAFPHWLNGGSGSVVPFSQKDNGADLVETSFLMEGLLIARQYFNGPELGESTLRNDINTLWNAVEWNWFRKNNETVLYWHWSPNYNWEINQPITGWNECLITYVLAASSPNYAIPKTVYDNGWAKNGAIKNGNYYYNIQLPLGSPSGGPLFFAHYSFLGINPNNLKDAYADYGMQNKAHTLINYNYCRTNLKDYYGYSDACWGLTASDDINGYLAHEPNNDNGVISPTAAISSLPYTPDESMRAIRFFYYKLGDKIWKNYGFVDAFSLKDGWFANSFLAIDQGPEIAMIENYRSGLLWNLFMSCPEVKTGMRSLGFQGPDL